MGGDLKRHHHPRLASWRPSAVLLLAVMGGLSLGSASAMERPEKPPAMQSNGSPDAAISAAQEDVRRAEEKARSLRRVGGAELREAQEEMVAARERLRVLTNASSERAAQAERQQWIERMRREKDEEAAKQAELARRQQEAARQHAEDQRLAKERQEADRQREKAYWDDRMRKLEERNRRDDAAREQAQVRQRQEQQREQAKPQNVLTRLYASYIQVKRCHASLAGRAFVYVDDRELATARDQTKFVEGKLAGAAPELDREAAWQAANARDPAELLFTPGVEDVEAGVLSERGQGLCRGALAAVKDQYLSYNPDAAIVKKDF